MKAIGLSRVLRPLVVGSLFAGIVLVGAGPASAQDSPPPAPPPAVSSGGGNGIGVGAAAFLSGLGGVQVDYDQSIWDIEGILGFANRRDGGPGSPTSTVLQAGVRGWYHLHRGANSDFSLGGGIGFQHRTGNGPSQTSTLIEPGARARAFITSNVAAFAILGFTIVVGDNALGNNNTGIALGAQPLFGVGFTYYFK